MAVILQDIDLRHHTGEIDTSGFRINWRIVALFVGSHLLTDGPHFSGIVVAHRIIVVAPSCLYDATHLVARGNVIVHILKNLATWIVRGIVGGAERFLLLVLKLVVHRLQTRTRDRLTDRYGDRIWTVKESVVIRNSLPEEPPIETFCDAMHGA